LGTYVVTGSASGIGAALRARLEQGGHQVIGLDLRDAEVIADLSAEPGRAAALELVDKACTDLSTRLHGVACCAGLGPPSDPAAMVSVNFFGAAAVLQGLRPMLANQPDTRAVVVSSNAATTTPDIPVELVDACLEFREADARALAAKHGVVQAYSGSKLAISRLVRRLAPTADWIGAGVRLNAVAPGATLTPLLQGGLDSEEFGPQVRDYPIPVGGFATADQIAFWVEAALVGSGGAYLCGSVLYADGGSDAMMRPDDWPATGSFG
jgi:NAD(P)-dependent dehydrogenase (short-subunit alcohol dehydrogenase family)